MDCANPDCNHGIGLVAYRRGWSSKRRYCSKPCCDSSVAAGAKRSRQERSAMTYFEWVFSQPIENPQPKLIPVRVRAR
jgi:hypothetical protein